MTKANLKASNYVLTNLLRIPLIHVAGFSLYPILFLYVRNRWQLALDQVIIFSLFSFGLAMLMYFFIKLLIKDRHKAGLIVSYLFFYFFSYGAIYQSFRQTEGFYTIRHFWPATIWTLICFYCLYKILAAKRFVLAASVFCNVTALSFCFISIIRLHSFAFTEQDRQIRSPSSREEMVNFSARRDFIENATKLKISVAAPDIYYLILDGYARNDVLLDLYNFDNSSFTKFLEKNGFFVAKNSYANYCQTSLSLASSLNGIYLDALADRETNSYSHIKKLISEAAICHILKAHGYEIIALRSFYSLLNLGKTPDRNITIAYFNNDFHRILFKTTILSAIDLPFLFSRATQAESHMLNIERHFSVIPQVTLSTQPAFFFAHITCPHPPFLFRPDGRSKPCEDINFSDGAAYIGMTSDEYKNGYIDQIQYVNMKTTQLISELLSRTRKRPIIIILQSDHGPGSELHWDNATKTNQKERMAILNAIYYSDGEIANLNNDISPVNTFRNILNHLCGGSLSIQANHSYFSTLKARYDFIDVTERLKK